MSIRGKLMLGFALIVAFIAGQAMITYFYLNKSEQLVKHALINNFSNSTTISKMAILAQKLRRYEKEYFIYADNQVKRQKYTGEWNGAYKELQAIMTSVQQDNSGIWSQNDKAEFDKWHTSLEDYHRGFSLVTENVDRGLVKGTLEANFMIQEAKNRFKVLLKGTSTYGARKLVEANKSEEEINSNFSLINKIVLITSVAGVVLAILLMIVIPGAISRPIGILTKSAHLMSTGDLGQPVPLTTGSEFKDLAETLERMRVSQKTLMDRYRSNRS